MQDPSPAPGSGGTPASPGRPEPEDLAYAGVAGQAALLRDRVITAGDLLESVLARIAGPGRALNAFVDVLADTARAEAAAADALLSAGAAGPATPLLGVPIAVKGGQDVAGVATRHGTSSPEPPAVADSEVVTRLRRAGAVIVGTTTLPELAVWGFTEPPATGATRNPYDVGRSPGGSSGGSAAAVAAGLVAAATASDGAGSIRIPAACCGLVGLKPTRALVPLGRGPDAEHWNGLSVEGFLTRTVDDTALLLDLVAERPAGAPALRDAVGSDPGRLRIGVSDRPPMPGPVSPAARAALTVAREALARLGHDVGDATVDVGPPGLLTAVVAPLYLNGVARDAARLVEPGALSRPTAEIAALGRRLAGRVPAARRGAARLAQRVDRVFDTVDLLVVPVLAREPLRIGELAADGFGSGLRTMLRQGRYAPFPVLWNVTGHPSISLPVGGLDDPQALPMAVQVVARHGREDLLLAVAAQLEALLGWPSRRPDRSAGGWRGEAGT